MPPAKKTARRRATKKAPEINVEVLDGDRFAVHFGGRCELLTIPFTEEVIKNSAPEVAAHYQTLLDAIKKEIE